MFTRLETLRSRTRIILAGLSLSRRGIRGSWETYTVAHDGSHNDIGILLNVDVRVVGGPFRFLPFEIDYRQPSGFVDR